MLGLLSSPRDFRILPSKGGTAQRSQTFLRQEAFSRYQRLSHLALLSSMLTRSIPSPVVGAVDVVKPSEKRVVVGPIDRVDGDPRGLR